MTGLVENVLIERYGNQTIIQTTQFIENHWNDKYESLRCLLFKAVVSANYSHSEQHVLEQVYGDVLGGFLLLDSLKLAMITGPTVYGLYTLDELYEQPEVRDAKVLDPDIQFFMDAANVWFYGIKQDKLYVYDSETSELTQLGPFKQAFVEILKRWEQTNL
jgi:hypothetical protein